MSDAHASSTTLGRARLLIVLCYLAAGVGSLVAGYLAPTDDAVWVAFVADVAATFVVFLFSRAYDNSSFYDAYWSVIPPFLGLFWLTDAAPDANVARQVLALGLTTLWGIRLTYNWARGWTGLGHEDWRYVDLREKTGKLYWVVSFLGLHYFPTVEVFAGCLGLHAALTAGGRPFGPLDVAATLVTAGAIAIEAIADNQLRAFVLRPGKPSGSIMNEGLWAYSRHPNYFGEMSFWWGLFLFGLAADPESWRTTLYGPVAITVMFFFVSVPMMEKRQIERRPAFAEHVKRTSMIIPWFAKSA